MNTNIKLKDLLNYPLAEIPFDNIWDIEYIVERFDLPVYELQSDKLDKSLFKIKSIYDNPHGSDESSYRRLLFFKGKFCCLYGFTGDKGKSSVSFSSKEKANELFLYLNSLKEHEDGNSLIIGEDEDVDISDDYTTFFEKDGTFYYTIDSPKWSYRFGLGRCKVGDFQNLYCINDNGEILKAAFVKFKTDDSYGEKPEDKYMVLELETKQQVEVPYHQVIFKV